MAEGNGIDGVIDLTDRAQGSLSQNIGKLQQLIEHSGEFKKVAKYFDKVPEWSSEEGRHFMTMMEHIKRACDSYGQVLGGTRRYVISAKAFSKDTVTFLTDVQEEDLEPDDIEDIFGDFTDSIDKMKESNREVEVLREEFRSVLMRLRDAQTEAAGGKVRGKKKAAEAGENVGYGILGTIGAGITTVMTVGVATPLVLAAGAGYIWKNVKDKEKCKEWEEAFNFVLRRLDELYSVLDAITNECTNVLDQLSHSSDDIMKKSKRMTAKKNYQSKHMKEKCGRLVKDSGKLERACIEYIRADDEIRGIAGAMNRLSLE